MKFFIVINKVKDKIKIYFYKNLFKELTGNNVKSMKILGDISIINTNIKIGTHVTFFKGVTIFGDGKIEIGDNVSIGENTILYASKNGGGITIGSNVQIAAQSYLIDTDHGINANELIKNQKNNSEPIIIEDDVWVGAGAKILKGAILKEGCVVAAQAVVKRIVPHQTIVGGVPAKKIGVRRMINE